MKQISVMMSRMLTDQEEKMWYLVWLVGFPLAAAFAVLNAIWYELKESDTQKKNRNSL